MVSDTYVFYKTDGIHTYFIKLNMINKLWYIPINITSTLYCDMVTHMNDAFVAIATGTELYNLCHFRHCHAGEFVCNNIHKSLMGFHRYTRKSICSFYAITAHKAK